MISKEDLVDTVLGIGLGFALGLFIVWLISGLH